MATSDHERKVAGRLAVAAAQDPVFFGPNLSNAAILSEQDRGILIKALCELQHGHLEPIPMLIACPTCGTRHVDVGEFATKPHHTHACQTCGMCWRPAVVATVGVHFLPGFKDETT